MDSPLKCCKSPQDRLKMTEFSKIRIFVGTNFCELCQKPRNLQNFTPAKTDTNKVSRQYKDHYNASIIRIFVEDDVS